MHMMWKLLHYLRKRGGKLISMLSKQMRFENFLFSTQGWLICGGWPEDVKSASILIQVFHLKIWPQYCDTNPNQTKQKIPIASLIAEVSGEYSKFPSQTLLFLFSFVGCEKSPRGCVTSPWRGHSPLSSCRGVYGEISGQRQSKLRRKNHWNFLSLEQRFSTWGVQWVRGSPKYHSTNHIFALQLITAAKSQLWGSDENNIMVWGHHNMRTCVTGLQQSEGWEPGLASVMGTFPMENWSTEPNIYTHKPHIDGKALNVKM